MTMTIHPTERLQLKIGGMSCSFCSMTIERVLTRMEGVSTVHVSLAHEEALIEYDPSKRSPLELRDTLRKFGYTVRDPDKVKAFAEQQAELQRARNLLLWGAAFTLITLALMILRWLGIRQPLTPAQDYTRLASCDCSLLPRLAAPLRWLIAVLRLTSLTRHPASRAPAACLMPSARMRPPAHSAGSPVPAPPLGIVALDAAGSRPSHAHPQPFQAIAGLTRLAPGRRR